MYEQGEGVGSPEALLGPPSFAIDTRHARAGGYYLGNSHGLIHRHTERVSLGADESAKWELKIDLALPLDPEARCGTHNGECLFLFPLAFLKKAEGHTGFGARDETGASIPLPTRATCDWVSARAAAGAANRIEQQLRREAAPDRRWRALPREDLVYILQCVASMRPYDAAIVLDQLLHALDKEVAKAWRVEGLGLGGLEQDLKMLVEHWMLWVPLRGVPGERRQISLEQDIELLPRSFFRWRVGELSEAAAEEAKENEEDILDTSAGCFGRIGQRVDFSVLGERLALPFAWMPIDFDFPTIYTRRCASYRFELICPTGLSPRAIKIAHRPGLPPDKKAREKEIEEEEKEVEDEANRRGMRKKKKKKGDRLDATEIMGRRSGHAYLGESRAIGDLMVRATVGIGQGAFPSLWLLMGSVTTFMLWYVVAVHPTDLVEASNGSKAQIAAAILLLVPAALLGAIAIVEGSISRLIGGSRLLLLAAGLSAAFAARVFIGGEPLDLSELTQWTLCAIVATVATVPLATSWLLSLPMVGRRLAQYDSVEEQRWAFRLVVYVAISLIACLVLAPDYRPARAVLALALLVTAVPLNLLATNRLQTPIVETRDFLSFGTIFAATVCVAIACVELHTALVASAHTSKYMELSAMILLLAAVPLGHWLRLMTHGFHEKVGEVHAPPGEVHALLLGRRVRELLRLQASNRDPKEEPASSTEANRSSGVRSTVTLPDFNPKEFLHVCGQLPHEELDTPLRKFEAEAGEKLPVCMRKIDESQT
jgi:hypothetical protein